MSFDFNILSDLLFTVPFIVGYTRPMYRSQEIYREALLRGDIYQENLEETKAWQEYQEELRKEEKKGIFASFAGALVGSVIGFFTGGPPGAKIGWNAGKALGRNIRKQDKKYFDATTYLTSNPVFRGGKFNRQLDRANWREAINDAEDRDDMMQFQDLMDVGKGMFVGVTTDWSEFGGPGIGTVKDWNKLSFKDQFNELIESFKVAKMDDFLKAWEDRQKDLVGVAGETAFNTSLGVGIKGSGVGFQPDIDLVSEISADYGIPTHRIDPLDNEKILKNLNKVIDNYKERILKDPSLFGIDLGDKFKGRGGVGFAPDYDFADNLKEKEELKKLIGVETPLMPTTADYSKTDVIVGKDVKELPPFEKKSILRNLKQEDVVEDYYGITEGPKIKKDAPSLLSTKVETSVMEIPTFYNKSTGSAMEININEWKPMEAMVDNLKDRIWKPMDYDWRIDNNKFLWRDWQPFGGRKNKISGMDKITQTNLDLANTNKLMFEGPPGPPQPGPELSDIEQISKERYEEKLTYPLYQLYEQERLGPQLFDMNKELQIKSSLDALEANPLSAPSISSNWQNIGYDTTYVDTGQAVGNVPIKNIYETYTLADIERARQYISDNWMPDNSINKEAYRALGGQYIDRYEYSEDFRGWKGD